MIKPIGIIFACSFLLAGCAGTGTSNYSYVAPVIFSDEKGKVFVLRESGFSGSGALTNVAVNGTSVGQLGTGEMLIANTNKGLNVLQVKVSGLQGMGLNSPTGQFQNDGDHNNYFVIGLKTGLLKNELTLLETTESSWKEQVN